jgi:pyrophosphate--fructose-6-phosphate 1-phosphotransferase
MTTPFIVGQIAINELASTAFGLSVSIDVKRQFMTAADEFRYQFKWFKDDFDTDPRTRGRLFVHRSRMEEQRSLWEPPVPSVFRNQNEVVTIRLCDGGPMPVDPSVIDKWPEFSQGMKQAVCLETGVFVPSPDRARVGIVLTGEWAPSSGTHNVIIGIVRFVCDHMHGEVLGFLGGPQGFARNHYIQLTPEKVRNYLNQGGADLLGFGSLRAIDESDYSEIMSLCRDTYRLTSLVFIGGPNELAHVSQIVQFSMRDPVSKPTIVGVFQSPNSNVFHPTWIPVTLGYDSTRCTLAEMVGNISQDGLSSGRPNEVNIIRCGSTTMTMEISLLVGPAMTILADEMKTLNYTLTNIVDRIRKIGNLGLKTATILLSDKFYQCLPTFGELQAECRSLYVSRPGISTQDLLAALSPECRDLLLQFPLSDQRKIARAYDQDGRPTWPDLEPEKFLAYLLRDSGLVVRTHNVGQEARCPLPTNFDCMLGLGLGYTAAALSMDPRCHGYVAGIRNLDTQEWVCGGIPLASLLAVRPENSGSVLAEQFGGANQELINLAKQRVEREASVPMIPLRPGNILDDCLYKLFRTAQGSGGEPSVCMRQPGPYQFTSNCEERSHLPLSLLAAGTESVSSCIPSRSYSWLEKQRQSEYIPQCPLWLLENRLRIRDSAVTTHRSALNVLQLAFPRTHAVPSVEVEEAGFEEPNPHVMRIGIVFLGRAAPGCHNIVYGLIRAGGSLIKLLGFRNGAAGLLSGDVLEISESMAEQYVNLSGIDLLGRTETPIRSSAELSACARTCGKLKLNGLVVVGGVGTHADTALLAERLPTRVIGIPASIENDIPLVACSLGFDTACKTIASIVGCLGTLAASTKRQWCFVRIAGRSLSHIIAQVGRLTHPNLVILSEELEGWSLADLVSLIADLISERAKKGMDFGIVVFPESVLEKLEEVDNTIGTGAELVLESLVGKELQRRRMFGDSSASAFRSSTHVVSHQARSGLPSNFDCDLGFTMGVVAEKLLRSQRTGLLLTVSTGGGIRAVPLTSLLTVAVDKQALECRFEIQQRRVSLKSVFGDLPCPSKRRFMNPGPLQFGDRPLEQSPSNVVDQMKKIERIARMCSRIMSSGRRRVVKSGLEHTLALLTAVEDDEKNNGFANSVAPPTVPPHCRVIKLVPI